MLFFFKEKPIEIIAYISEKFSYVNQYSPIAPAKNNYPSWWKSIPSGKFNWEKFKAETTVKACPAVINSVSKGFIMPLWCDIAIEHTESEYRVDVADKRLEMGVHSADQSPGFYSDFFHFKIASPWFIKSSVDLIYLPPTYQTAEPTPYITMPGIIPPLGGYAGTHVFIFSKKSPSTKIYLKQNTPLLHIIPLTEKKIKFRTEVVEDKFIERAHRLCNAPTHHTAAGVRQLHFLNNKKP